MGESLLVKEVEIEIKIDREYGFTRARMVTNPIVLTPVRARSLLDTGLDLLVASIYCDNIQSYEWIGVYLKFDKVIKYARFFIWMREFGIFNA